MAKQSDSQRKDFQKKDAPRKDKGNNSELVEKVLHVNRCAKVVSGGRKFSFSALILVGDKKGRVGIGFAKANELTDAIRRGGELARKNMTSYAVEGTTIPHEILVHWDGATVLFKPAPKGAGIIAGSRIRSILELVGLKDIVAKSLGANNPINTVHAVFKALSLLRKRQTIKSARGMA